MRLSSFHYFYLQTLLVALYAGSFLFVWHILTITQQSLAFPALLQIFDALYNSVLEGYAWEDIKVSIIRVMAGWLLAIVVGTTLGILAGYYTLYKPLDYINDFLRYLPVPAFVPLVLVWFGIGELSKIFLIFLGVFVQVITMVSSEIRNFPKEYKEVGLSIGMNKHRILINIILDGIKPNLWEIYRINLGWAWTYLLIGEVVAANEGLGYRLMKSQRFLQMDVIYAYLIIIGLIGLFSDGVFRALKPYLFPYTRRG